MDEFVTKEARVLVLGAGGIGCEVLKNLVKYGVYHVEVVDMDVVELSNLNRQFMFGRRSIGKPKVEAAVSWVLQRFPQYQGRIIGHYRRIEELQMKFYESFHLIVGGLDSVESRRWVNGMLMGLDCTVPYVDGGSEGFRGHCISIIPGFTACIECLLPLFDVNNVLPVCTLAGKPRTLEHCVQWAAHSCDEDDPGKIVDLASAKAVEHGIDAALLSVEFVESTLKRVVPAISTTNSLVAGICVRRALDILTGRAIDESYCNYVQYNGEGDNEGGGCYLEHLQIQRNPDCTTCRCIRNF